jgi:sugar phosphate isomerase/epimerase
MYNRRELGRITLAGLAAPLVGAFALTGSDARVGVHTRSFRGIGRAAGADPIAALIDALAACDVHHCELFAPQIEAQFGSGHAGHHTVAAMSPQMMRRELRKWRLRTPAGYFRTIGKRFEKAGVAIAAYNYSPDASFTDEEIDVGFAAAKALGAAMITASTTLEVAKRIAPIAERHRMVVALGDATPQGFTAVDVSKYFRLSVDIGDFTAANVDAVAFIREHHRDIASLRLKDRRKDHGETRPWGQGDTPIREVLRLVRRESWPIRGYVEYDYAGAAAPIDEVKKCLAYAAEATTM